MNQFINPCVSRVTASNDCPVLRAMAAFAMHASDRPLTLAYSGGMDSAVLLHACVMIGLTPKVVHVHHGLQARAEDWAAFAQQQASDYGLDFILHRVQLEQQSRRGIEDLAREARYAALWSSVADAGILITAHHQRDQAETFLLRLMRGSGVAGLSAMSAWQQRLDSRVLARPLLFVCYNDMQAYAQRHGLTWVEDPTNADTNYAQRNRVRHQLLPALAELTPDYDHQIAKTSIHMQEAQQLLDELAQIDWQQVKISQRQFSITAWRQLSWQRAKNALRYAWVQLTGGVLEVKQWQLVHDQFYLVVDGQAHPRFCHRQQCLLMDQGIGYLLPLQACQRDESISLANNLQKTNWYQLAELSFLGQTEQVSLCVRTRLGGEKVSVDGRFYALKHWLAEQKIPAWQKAIWPVIYAEHTNELLGWANMPDSWWQQPEHQVHVVWQL
jgi:tRNA(Ile)-lysidine synthase